MTVTVTEEQKELASVISLDPKGYSEIYGVGPAPDQYSDKKETKDRILSMAQQILDKECFVFV